MAARFLSALVLTACMVASVLTPTAPANAQDFSLDTADPGTVVLECSTDASSVDLNHASTVDLMEALSISRPVALRVIAARPHYSAGDLLMVSGIGPGKVRRIIEAGNTCATPLAFPPPVPTDACRGDEGEVDIQLGSIDELREGLNLSRPAATRLIERRDMQPFPTVDHALTIAGVGPGKLKRYENACFTPPNIESVTVDGNNVGYAWVSPHRGGQTSIEASDGEGDYGLTVPPDVVEDGAWAEVIDLPQNFDTDGPRAEFHIYGVWTGNVDVTLPVDPFDESSTSEAVSYTHLTLPTKRIV